MRILIVDDMESMRMVISSTLRMLGYEDLQQAENGKAAMRVIQKSTINLVITDLNMPLMDGLELTKEIKASKEFKTIPVLVVTCNAEKEMVEKTIECGADSFIVKPFTPNCLKQKIEYLLNPKII